jgi:hypothetical protein
MQDTVNLHRYFINIVIKEDYRMAAFTANYDWSKWDRASIANMAFLVKSDIVNHTITVDRFHEIMSRHLKKCMPVRASKSRESMVAKTFAYVGGCYYTQYDKDRQKSIEISFAYNPTDHTLCLTKRRFYRLCWRIADVVLHEIIHMQQARSRRFKDIPGFSSTAHSTKLREQQEYFGDPDEIDAYAFNMACELDDRFGRDMTRIVDYLNQDQKGRRRRVYDTWCSYLKAFNYDQNHRVIRKIKKRSIYYLTRNQLDRPFLPRNWINR